MYCMWYSQRQVIMNPRYIVIEVLHHVTKQPKLAIRDTVNNTDTLIKTTNLRKAEKIAKQLNKQ